MKRGPFVAVVVAVVIASGVTLCVWRHQAKRPDSDQLEVASARSGARSEAHSGYRSRNQVSLLLEDPVGALFELYKRQQEPVDSSARAANEDVPATATDEPSLFNVDVVAVGPRAYEVALDPGLLDPEAEGESTHSDSKDQAPGSAVNGLSDDTAHNEQILAGKVTTEDQSIGPKEVDPDSHPSTN